MAETIQDQIIVVGSLNADLVQRVERLPRPGETISAGDLAIVPGGKGANQAYAAALLGASVSMVGDVGDDAFGPMLRAQLAQAGVDTSRVGVSGSASGTAAILVLPSGENVIVISPGANGKLTPQSVKERLEVLAPGPRSILLTQLEVPLETTRLALKFARACGAKTILDPAPAQQLDDELLASVDLLTPNQTEAALLLNSHVEIHSYEDGEAAAQALLGRGPGTVLLKLGELGVVIANSCGCERIAGFPVRAVDTTAAGDTFNGALAVALREGKSLSDAARFANAAAAISVTRHGAQSSVPARTEVDAFLEDRPS